jgi:hypothetical protein
LIELLVDPPKLIEELAALVEICNVVCDRFCGGRHVEKKARYRLPVGRHGHRELLGESFVRVEIWVHVGICVCGLSAVWN